MTERGWAIATRYAVCRAVVTQKLWRGDTKWVTKSTLDLMMSSSGIICSAGLFSFSVHTTLALLKIIKITANNFIQLFILVRFVLTLMKRNKHQSSNSLYYLDYKWNVKVFLCVYSSTHHLIQWDIYCLHWYPFCGSHISEPYTDCILDQCVLYHLPFLHS